MKLKDWRQTNGKTQKWVADELNKMADAAGDPEQASQSSVDRWEKGTIPRQANMRRLMELTDHAVTFDDFYDDGVKPKRRARHPLVSSAASRKAARSRRAQREARP